MISPVADKLRESWSSVGISDHHIYGRGLSIYEDPADLKIAETSRSGRPHRLVPATATAWRYMKEAAAGDSVEIYIISGHRSIERQTQLIARKLSAGQSLEEILSVVAPPGCSEHHTGRAIDIGTPQSAPLQSEFERTAAFRWLEQNAGKFGFRLSYPPANEWGFVYEPWHWCHTEAAAQQVVTADV